ncbi:GATA transcription factor 5-like [Apium graveolens]|uniref:GATA transcription factor 5-like n=1 Tax=Apium graveolens TaxID=4045 RepID=UPI003D7BC2DD
MDLCQNISVPGDRSPEYEPKQLFSPCSKLGSLDDMLSSNSMEGDINLEWLSIYVEDCFSSAGNCLPFAAVTPQIVEKTSSSNSGSTIIPKTAEAADIKPLQLVKPQGSSKSRILHKFVIPSKARSKRTRGPIGNKSRRITSQFTSWSHHLQMTNSDPPLLEQAYWLADSELILPKKEETKELDNGKIKQLQKPKNEEEKGVNNVNTLMMEKEEEIWGILGDNNGQQQARRCTHCLSQKTPQWRAGPLGPKTLCNACGVRYKSGRLLPEYRPAKSPTFVSYKHSNSHKKVLEMRTMSHLSSNSFFQ